MTTMTDTYEIPAVPGKESPFRRLTVALDVDCFWQSGAFLNTKADWTSEGIGDVMRWVRFRSDEDNCNEADLAVASPWVQMPQYRTDGFRSSWEQWVTQYSEQHTPLRFSIMHETGHPGPTDEFGGTGFQACARFYPAEFRLWLDPVTAWSAFFAEAAPTLHLDTRPVGYGQDLCEIFARGVICNVTDPRNRRIEEVVLLTGHTGELQARAFRTRLLEA